MFYEILNGFAVQVNLIPIFVYETHFFRCYGVVIFAGKDTKLMQNSGKTKFKRTSLDRFMNVLIIGIVIFLLSLCAIAAILAGIWEKTEGQYFKIFLPRDDAAQCK